MKTCNTCGKEIANDARFCTYCGALTAQNAATAQTEPQQSAPQQSAPQQSAPQQSAPQQSATMALCSIRMATNGCLWLITPL